jgi:mannan endo-1,4-beta-mannosidase
MNCPADWVRDIARFVKGLAPQKLLFDGTYGINKTHLSIKEVDVFSDHFYPVDTKKLQAGLSAVQGAGKVYFAGEYDWLGNSGGDSLESFFQIIENSPAAGGDAFWSLFGRNGPDCNVSFCGQIWTALPAYLPSYPCEVNTDKTCLLGLRRSRRWLYATIW